MADSKRIVQGNVQGDFFVDETCIDCGTCRHLAPASFAEGTDYSFVWTQPKDEKEVRTALHALLACPTGSIGTHMPKPELSAIRQDFPLHLTDHIYYNGYSSPQSYGASSYFITHPAGNWLIDCPKFIPATIRALEDKGGIAFIFLTHSDDVGDAAEFAKHFNATRIIHREELWSQPDAEVVIEGEEAIDFSTDFKIIPVPGHTAGSCCLLYRQHFLFSGDHCWWNPEKQELETPKNYYWNLQRLALSQQKLLSQYSVEWVFPGHGMGVCLSDPSKTF